MKKTVQTVGLLSLFAAGLPFSGQASAASACSAYGELQPGVNPSYQHVNCLLTEEALEQDIPPEVVKAVVTQENGTWKHFDENGNGNVSEDGGIGLMQLTNQLQFDQDLLKTDLIYNIESGVAVLDGMYDRNVPKISGARREIIENWYFPVMAYNGIKPVNSPLQKATGEVNEKAYQEQVFAKIEEFSFLKDTQLAAFPFQPDDFDYDPATSENIKFLKLSYTLTEKKHETAYHFQTGDRITTTGSPNLRNAPGGESIKIVPENTILTVTGPFQFNRNPESTQQFVWYPVETSDGQSGFISSAYIEKQDLYKEFDPKTNVEPDHTFTVQLNHPVDPATLKLGAVYILGPDGEVVPTKAVPDGNGKAVKIAAPAEGYKPGKTYTMFVESVLQSEAGGKLKDPVRMTFTIGPS